MLEMSLVEDEWEYEYDNDDVEVFLVDLDLTTVNQAIRSTSANRHKRLNEIATTVAGKKQKLSDKSNEIGSAATPVNVETASAGAETPGLNQASPNPQEHVRFKSLQILDLSSGNPIVAYDGEVYSCKWADMIGTNMFFANPQDVPLYESELSTAEYDMIGMSRIKLVGTKTKLTPIQQSVVSGHSVPAGQSLGTIRRNNAKVNADLRKQASFLEQLMNIKKDRGETDNVFVAMNDDIAAAVAAGKLNGIARAQVQNLKNLNREAVKGSADALQQIEQIYLNQNVNDIDEETISLPANAPNARPRQRTSKRPRVLGTASPSPEPAGPALGAPLQQNPNTNKDDT